jgi:hypothetical protein
MGAFDAAAAARGPDPAETFAAYLEEVANNLEAAYGSGVILCDGQLCYGPLAKATKKLRVRAKVVRHYMSDLIKVLATDFVEDESDGQTFLW